MLKSLIFHKHKSAAMSIPEWQLAFRLPDNIVASPCGHLGQLAAYQYRLSCCFAVGQRSTAFAPFQIAISVPDSSFVGKWCRSPESARRINCPV